MLFRSTGLEEMLQEFANGIRQAELQTDTEEAQSPSSEEGLDPAEVERALGNIFGLLQDLAQSGTLMQGDAGSTEPGSTPGWDSPFSEN